MPVLSKQHAEYSVLTNETVNIGNKNCCVKNEQLCGATSEMDVVMKDSEFFSKTLDLELQRAKRYRVFVSMTVFDLSFLRSSQDESLLQDSIELIRKNVRAIDSVAAVGEYKIGLLFPETPRQGAEVSSRRIAELLKDRLMGQADCDARELIPLEMVSYPDAAGARSFSDSLAEIAVSSRN